MTLNSFSKYRPEIDGLRAVAIIAVILFHTQKPLFSGGYVGVDVFFVISGYLITRNIQSYHKRGLPILSTFYMSRARRLLPAFLATLILASAASLVVLSPYHLENFARSALSSIALIPNVFFYHDAGYFQINDLFRPLLHYWSLGVEAQFYLIWSFLLSIVIVARPKLLFPTIVVIFVLSLIASEIVLRSDPEAVFFLVPYRLCEFMIGAACVYFTKSVIEQPIAREILTAIALIVILICVLTFKRDTLFPGLAAMPVCFATATIIAIGPTPIIGRLLDNRLSVYIGLISYSLYLVHWPIFTLYKYVRVESITIFEGFSLIIMAFTMAIIMYHWVEKPFRTRSEKGFRILNKSFATNMILGAVLVSGISVGAVKYNGWPSRFPADIQDAIGNVEEKREESWAPLKAQESSPGISRKNAVIIGDSFAKDIYNAIAINNTAVNFTRLAIQDKCQPMSGKRPFKGRDAKERSLNCENTFKAILDSNELASADIILLSASWRIWSIKKLSATIAEIRQRNNTAAIIVFGVRMEFLDVPKLVISHRELEGIDKFVNHYQITKQYKLNILMKNIAAEIPNLIYVDIIKLFCPNNICPIFTPENKLIYYDRHHWTLDGAKYFGEILRKSSLPVSQLLFPNTIESKKNFVVNQIVTNN